MQSNLTLELRLKETCRKTQACWAACLVRENTGWKIDSGHGLSKKHQAILLKNLEENTVSAWVSGALGSGRVRSRALDESHGLTCKKIYVFPRPNRQSVLMVGVPSELTIDLLSPWKELASDWLPAIEPSGQDEQDALGLANVFAQSISASGSIEHAVAQTSYFFEHTFSVNLLILALVSSDETNLTIYRAEPRRRKLIQVDVCPAEPFLPLAELQRPLPYADRSGLPESPLLSGCANGLVVPLQYRGGELGFVLVETPKKRKISELDTRLISLVVVQLAALAEYLRLRDEAEERERHFQETVEQLEETQQELQARIGAQREAELRLVQAAKLAAVGEMAAGVAHELNNPLTTVVGFTELLLDEASLPENARSDLDMVLREAIRARNVVRRLLDFSRQSESSRTRADLNEIVTDVMMLTKHLMRTSGVDLILNLAENLPWALLDRNQIKQVILNLVNNAIYAMPGGGKLIVSTRQSQRRSQPWLELAIQDTGVGIAPDALQRIFEPFFTTRGDKGGTGLGLSVTYGIVTDHGGSIEVESQVGQGTTFTVWLPLKEETE
jgi:signal transduction histidine kinase